MGFIEKMRLLMPGLSGHRAVSTDMGDGHPCHVRYLISPAGVPNFGDEFIARAWLRHLAAVEPDSEVWLDCINPGHASVLLCGEHPNLRVTNTAWSLVWNAQDQLGIGEHEAQGKLVTEWVRYLGTPKEDLGISKMLSADSIHLLGGGYVNGEWEANHALLPHIARVARDESDGRILLFATGMGIAPWDGADPSMRMLHGSMDAFDYVSLRDGVSASLLGKADAVMTGDDAWLGLVPGRMRGTLSPYGKEECLEAYHSRAYVSLQPNRSPLDTERTVSRIVDALLRSGVGSKETITMVEAMTPDDSFYLDALRKAWDGDVILLPFSVLWTEGFPSGRDGSTVWVTSRYHMHLIGAATGARGIAVMGGDEYYHVKHGALLNAGTGWGSLNLDDFRNAGQVGLHATRNDGFAGTARTLVATKVAEANRLYGSEATGEGRPVGMA